jgi:uncharacterized protein
MTFERPQVYLLRKRLDEAPTFITVVAGPRQIGKSTAVKQALANKPHLFVATDQPSTEARTDEITQIAPGTPANKDWLVAQWTRARAKAGELSAEKPFVLAIDEIQKIRGWSDVVKGLWDDDRAQNRPLHVVLLGSSPWLMQKGLTESLAGRYELIRMTHWSYPEMQEAFDFSLDEYMFFGAYPGAARLIQDEQRWRHYVRDALIHPAIDKDILDMTRVDKPALLKHLFELGCAHSGQIIAYSKLLGQLQDAGNTVTLAHYLELLSQAGMLTGLAKYSAQQHRQRASSPKLNALNTALISAQSSYTFLEARNDRSHWGQLMESTVGAHLFNSAADECQVQYWRESPNEVDFILSGHRKLIAIEVKSSAHSPLLKGMQVFMERNKVAKSLLVGAEGIPLTEFLSHPAEHWLE